MSITNLNTDHNVNLLPIVAEIFLAGPLIDRLRVDGKIAELLTFYQIFQKTFVCNTFKSIFRDRLGDLLFWNAQLLTQVIHCKD